MQALWQKRCPAFTGAVDTGMVTGHLALKSSQVLVDDCGQLWTAWVLTPNRPKQEGVWTAGGGLIPKVLEFFSGIFDCILKTLFWIILLDSPELQPLPQLVDLNWKQSPKQ